jgi:hypothetical protein
MGRLHRATGKQQTTAQGHNIKQKNTTGKTKHTEKAQ